MSKKHGRAAACVAGRACAASLHALTPLSLRQAGQGGAAPAVVTTRAAPVQVSPEPLEAGRVALGPGDDDEVLCICRDIYLTRSSISCLKPHGWLEDDVLNAYMGLLQVRRACTGF